MHKKHAYNNIKSALILRRIVIQLALPITIILVSKMRSYLCIIYIAFFVFLYVNGIVSKKLDQKNSDLNSSENKKFRDISISHTSRKQTFHGMVEQHPMLLKNNDSVTFNLLAKEEYSLCAKEVCPVYSVRLIGGHFNNGESVTICEFYKNVLNYITDSPYFAYVIGCEPDSLRLTALDINFNGVSVEFAKTLINETGSKLVLTEHSFVSEKMKIAYAKMHGYVNVEKYNPGYANLGPHSFSFKEHAAIIPFVKKLDQVEPESCIICNLTSCSYSTLVIQSEKAAVEIISMYDPTIFKQCFYDPETTSIIYSTYGILETPFIGLAYKSGGNSNSEYSWALTTQLSVYDYVRLTGCTVKSVSFTFAGKPQAYRVSVVDLNDDIVPSDQILCVLMLNQSYLCNFLSPEAKKRVSVANHEYIEFGEVKNPNLLKLYFVITIDQIVEPFQQIITCGGHFDTIIGHVTVKPSKRFFGSVNFALIIATVVTSTVFLITAILIVSSLIQGKKTRYKPLKKF